MNTSLFSLAFSGLLVLISWIGWGWGLFASLRLHRSIRPRWPLFAATGMSLLLAIGGIASLLRITSVITLTILTAAGCLLAVFALLRSQTARRSIFRITDLHRRIWLIPLIAMALTLYAASVTSSRMNPGDDLQAYLVFPKQMLQTGTLLDPFNMRRLGTYGGQQFLQAQLIAVSQTLGGEEAANISLTHGHILDDGLCTLIAGALLWGMFRPKTPQQHFLAFLAVAAFFLMPIPRANTHAQNSGTMLFLALAATLPPLAKKFNLRLAVLAGLFAAGAGTLRMNLVGGAFITLLVVAAIAFLRRRNPYPRIHLIAPLLVMLLTLTPWAIVLYQSSGTPFYPIIHGNQRGNFLQTSMRFLAHLQWSAASLLYPKLLMMLFPLIFAIGLRLNRAALPLYTGALVMTATLAWSFTNEDTANIYRLSSPMLFACAWVTLIAVLKRWDRLTPLLRGAALFLLLALPCVASIEFSEAFRTSSSLWILPLLLIAPFLATRPSRPLKHVTSILTMLLILWLTWLNRNRVADNGTIFLFISSLLLLAWSARAANSTTIRILTAATFTLVALVFCSGLAQIYGLTIVVSLIVTVLALSTTHRARTVARKYRSITLLAIVILAGLALIIIPFLLDHFSPWVFNAALTAAAWLAHKMQRTLKIFSHELDGVPCPVGGGPAGRAFADGLQKYIVAPLALFFAGILLIFPASREFTHAQTDTPYPPGLQKIYRDAQATIPTGATIFAFVPEPALLQFDRNTIDFADYQPHFVSPPPGIPVDGSLTQFRAYWKSLGIRYLMLSNDGMREDGTAIPQSLQLNFDALQHASRLLYTSPHLTIIDLGE